ncbi:hypothetical protein [Paraburkholderia bonniea]|uniref:hypothetical protein n=1 Tax=Paraburkholderia bonniea TaxID=2152891 RepID=UPI001290A720|nr:hypothetical protein [Paraburkholderia bonniea]
MKHWQQGALIILIAASSMFLMWKMLRPDKEDFLFNQVWLKPVQTSAAISTDIPEAREDASLHNATEGDVLFSPVFERRDLLVDGDYSSKKNGYSDINN